MVSRRAVLAAFAAPAMAQIQLPPRIRVGIVGIEGHTNLILGPASTLPNIEIVAISDTDANAVARFMRTDGALANARTYNDYRRMLDAEHLDVIAICNNNGERAEAILAGLERRVPVIAEKPLAITREGLERVKAVVQGTNAKLGMLLDMRFEPPYQALRQIVKSGALGEVAQISAQKSYKAGKRENWYKHRETYGSTILWIGIHMIDLMRFTSGRELRRVSSFSGHVGFPELGDMDNTTVSAFQLDNGGTATLHMDYYRPETAATHGDDRLRLAGTGGVAEYTAASGVTLVTGKSKLTRLTELPPASSVFVEFLENVFSNKPTSLPPSEIFRICEVTLAAHEAAIKGRVVEIS